MSGASDGFKPGEEKRTPGSAASRQAIKFLEFGDYELLEEIARGGMGIVYKARQKSLGRLVALKMILSGQLAGEEELKRFRTEAEAAAKLDHPNIVPIYEIGEHEGCPYFTMRLVEGSSLAAKIEAGTGNRADGKRERRRKMARAALKGLLSPALSSNGGEGEETTDDKGLDSMALGRSSPGSSVGASDGPSRTQKASSPQPSPPEEKTENAQLVEAAGRDGSDVQFPLTPALSLGEREKPFGSPVDNLLWAAKLIAAIAGAVHHAHQRGVLHRDLKPSNILIGQDGQPYITDFGLAKVLTQKSDLTISGDVVGTPNYMSPEQAEGRTAEVTTVSDVFSLGAILYQMLTGQGPFDGDTPLQTLNHVVKTEPRRPSAINPAVDRDLETICLKCLEKNPQRRYASANALAEDLGRWGRHEPILARPVNTPTRILKWTRRRPAIAALIALAMVALAGFTILMVLEQRRLRGALADTLLREGDLLAAKGNFAEAKTQASKSWMIRDDLGASTLAAELSLTDIYRISPPPLLTLTGHVGKVTCVAVSPDQHRIYSGGNDGTIRLWSCPFGRLEAIWNAHPGGVASIAFSPEGKYLLSAGRDDKLRIWDPTNPIPLSVLAGYSNPSSISFSPSNNIFAAASVDGVVRICEVVSTQKSAPQATEIRTLRAPGQQLLQVAFSLDGRRLAAGTVNSGWLVWNLAGAEEPAQFETDRDHLSVAWMPDGTNVLRGDSRGVLFAWNPGSLVHQPAIRMESPITALAFFPSTTRVLSGASDGNIVVWDVAPRTPEPLVRFSDHQNAVTAIATFADGRLAVSTGEDGTLRVWDTACDEELSVVRAHDYSDSSAAFSRDGRLLLSCGSDGMLKLWDRDTRSLLKDYLGHDGAVFDAEFSPDGRQAVSAGLDGTVRIWDVAPGTESRRFSVPKNRAYCVAFSPDARLIVCGEGPLDIRGEPAQVDRAFQLYVWEAGQGGILRAFPAHHGGVLAIAFSPDGRTLLTGGGDGKMRLWSTSTWQEIRSLDADKQALNGVAFTQDGRRCFSAGALGTLKIWDVATGREMKSLGPLRDEPLCVAVSSDSSLLLTGLRSGNLLLWDLQAGRALHSFHLTGSICRVAFAPSGKRAVSCDGGLGVRFWDFERGGDSRSLESAAARAQAALQQDPRDPQALQKMAEWYRFRQVWNWAAEAFATARLRGAQVPSLTVAQCEWKSQNLDRALQELTTAKKLHEATDAYFQLFAGAISNDIFRSKVFARANIAEPVVPTGAFVVQPGPEDGKDIWTTSLLSCTTGGQTPGGGSHDERLRVGGYGDLYYSLLQFDLTGCPTNATSAVLFLYCWTVRGGGTPMHLDRITQPWDWRTWGTGRDKDRLWWADKPAALLWRSKPLEAPSQGPWYAVDVTDLYNAWQSERLFNFGLQLRPALPDANEHFNEFYSSDYTANPSLRPKLVIIPATMTTASAGFHPKMQIDKSP